jgi:hypothetical protein
LSHECPKKAPFCVWFFNIFLGGMPPDPPTTASQRCCSQTISQTNQFPHFKSSELAALFWGSGELLLSFGDLGNWDEIILGNPQKYFSGSGELGHIFQGIWGTGTPDGPQTDSYLVDFIWQPKFDLDLNKVRIHFF